MRTRTFVFSFIAHSAAICVAMVVRIFATTEIPDPPISTTFMMAAAAEVPEVQPPPPQRVVQSTAPVVSNSAAPLTAPDTIAPEQGDVPETLLIGASDIPGALGGSLGGLDVGPPPPRLVTPPPAPPQPLHVGGVVRPPQKVYHVAPKYPAMAQAARVSGMVIVEALIAEDGTVRDVKVMRSVPLLDASAIEAVRQWRFTPTLLNGVPVQVIMTVTVSFTLH
jgi:protein TonB